MTDTSTPIASDDSISQFVCDSLNVTSVAIVERIQSLWGAQGEIVRLRTDSATHPTCVLKHISLNPQAHHPRGWNTNASFRRKATSYEVERFWYEHYVNRTGPHCKVPQCLGTQTQNGKSLILLEDLSIAYPRRCGRLTIKETRVCLEWLAQFHATFLGDTGRGLWPEGCYWHLGTRADEFAAMPDGELKQAATLLAEKLSGAQYQTLVHGDAKVANFCFSECLSLVSGVDFQYVGRGCGIRDVAYFLGSCLADGECAEHESMLLDVYFKALRNALRKTHDSQVISAVENEWRSLYGVAWTDFYRFLLGWMPTHQKINAYTLSVCEATLSEL